MGKRIGIFGAVREEISDIRKRMQVEDTLKLGKADAWTGTWEGKDIVLVRTGIGKKRAEEALSRGLERFNLSMIVSTGYAGGVDPALKVGDILVADKVLERSSDEEFFTDPSLANRAMLIEPPGKASVHRGGLLTVEEAVCDPHEKRRVGEQYSVRGVEMETSAIARKAREKEIPLLSVRTISDAVDDELLNFTPFLEADGEVSKLKAGWYVLTHPGKLKEMNTLRVHIGRARQNLTEYLSLFVRSSP